MQASASNEYIIPVSRTVSHTGRLKLCLPQSAGSCCEDEWTGGLIGQTNGMVTFLSRITPAPRARLHSSGIYLDAAVLVLISADLYGKVGLLGAGPP